jgi:peptidoglycan/LPS O-acetylase OafA/YrhL
MASRHRRVPRALAWIGLISYSVYLVHFPLITLLAPVLAALGDGPGEIPAVFAFLALLFGLSWLTFRYVEQPGQRLARGALASGEIYSRHSASS